MIMIKNKVLLVLASVMLQMFNVEGGLTPSCGDTRSRSLSTLQRMFDDPLCAEQQYSLFWFTTSHLYLVATPIVPSCTLSYVFHDSYHGKEALSFTVGDAFPVEGINYITDNVALGEFKLDDIAQAFIKADGGTGSYLLDNFDVVTSNCATFIMNMIGELGLIVDETIMTYTARRLAAEGFIAGLLRDSPNLALLGVENPQDSEDGVLLDLLVRRYVKVHYEGTKERRLDITDALKCNPDRRLSNIYFESHDSARDIADQLLRCSKQGYSVMLAIVSGHMSLLAVPGTEDGGDLSCELILFHLLDPKTKSISTSNANPEDFATYPFDDISIEFGDLVESYNDFDPPPVFGVEEDYDVVTNNSATIIAYLLCSLGVAIDGDLLNFITDSFIDDKDIVMADISASYNLRELDMTMIPEKDPYFAANETVKTIRKLILYNNNTMVNSYCDSVAVKGTSPPDSEASMMYDHASIKSIFLLLAATGFNVFAICLF